MPIFLGSVRGDQRGFTLIELLVTIAILGIVMAAVFTIYATGNTVGLTAENRAEAQQTARAAMLMEEDLRLIGYGCPPAGCLTPPPAAPQFMITAASATAITFWADLTNTSTPLTANLNAGANVVNVVAGAGLGFAVGDTVYLINGAQFARHTVAATGAATITVNPAVACPPPAPSTPCPPPPLAYPQGAQVGRPRLIIYSWNPATLTLSKDPGDGTGLQPLATGIPNFNLRYFDTNDAEILPANPVGAANLANIRRIQISMTAQSAAALNRGIFTLNSSVRPRNL